jgi:hypothetical protein
LHLLQPTVAVSVCAALFGLSAPLLMLPFSCSLQLAALRDTYLLGLPLLEPFVAFLLRRISTTAGGIERLTEFELNTALQDALAASDSAGCARPPRVSAQVAAAEAGSGGRGDGGAAPAGGAVPRVQQLARLRLRVEPGWPLCLVVGEEMLKQYNAVLVLLLQVS